ncbi:hypothetical protein WJX74_001224 [Apatococcus lobatus]|uniref:PITH domain-containing protein n=1 Tax=Apatococcus lobatus TaxID=904363 RepID=A0AAW1RW56_9CHLO
MSRQGGCSCAHDHDCESNDCGPAWSLYQHIDTPRVWCLNELEEHSVWQCFRPWEQRLESAQPPLRSNEDDAELLIHVPFNGSIKVRAISIIGGSNGSAPAEMRAFLNREDLDFGVVADMQPTQKWDLQENGNGQLEYPTNAAKFNGVHSIDLHIPNNFGADQTEIHFIGFKGEYTQSKREAVNVVYEARALPQDHKVPGEDRKMPELM